MEKQAYQAAVLMHDVRKPRTKPLFHAHLDAARGIAALVVFSGHAREFFLMSVRNTIGLGAHMSGHAKAPISETAAVVTTVGHQAVIVFFVLSGYLVGGGVVRAVKAKTWSWRHYLLQRLTRLWVALIPVLILTFLLDNLGRHFGPRDSIYFQPMDLGVLSGNSSVATFIGNIAFLQTILVTTFGTNGPLWSLAYEFWYYILFPLAVLFAVGGSPVRRLGRLAAFGVVLIFVGWKIDVYFLIWLMGVAVVLLVDASARVYSRTGRWLALASFATAYALLLRYPINILLSDFIIGVLFSLSLLFLLCEGNKVSTEGVYPVGAAFLAKISYTLYLTHVPLLAFISAVLIGHWERWPLDFRHLELFGLVCVLAFGASYAVYWCFERNTDKVRAWILSRWVQAK